MSNACVPDEPAARQETFWACIDDFVRRNVTGLLEKVLLSEQQTRLLAGWNERSARRTGWRNGHYSRNLLTPHGPLKVKIPRCRCGPLDCSLMFDRYQRRLADVDRILRRAYLCGTSTRATAELAEQIFGGSLSHQTISGMMRWLDEQLAAWRQRSIEPIYRVVYIDGMHVDVVGGDRNVMLVAGQRDDGRLDVLDFCVSTGERCRELLADLRRRGLDNVQLFVSDESPAIRSALEHVYPEVAWQHCTFHRLKALRDKIGPMEYRDAMAKEASNIFRCPSQRVAVEQAVVWARRWKAFNPWAVQQFMEDICDSLRFYNLPVDWWKRVRTNNPMERTIKTLRMRLRLMGCFHDEPAIERAVFGQLARWHLIPELTQDS